MNIQDIASLKNAFPHHANRLDAIEKLLHEPRKYFRAVEQVRLILQMEEERLQSYARAGRLAQDAALINVIRSRRLAFEKEESQRAGSALMKLVLSETHDAIKKDFYTSRYFRYLEKPLAWIMSEVSKALNVDIDPKMSHKILECARYAVVFSTKLIRNRELRKEAWATVKTWFQGGPKRKAVATGCSYLKGKTMEFWRWAKGVFCRTSNMDTNNTTSNTSLTHQR